MPTRISVRVKCPDSLEGWINDYDKEFGDDYEVCVVTTKN